MIVIAKYKEMWEQEKQKNEQLQRELEQLKKQHNIRGAGRKAVLSKDDKDLIRYQYQCGMSMNNLAVSFGVSKSTIYNVIHE